MKTWKRILALGMAAALLAMSAVGCQNGDNGDSTEEAATGEAASTESTALDFESNAADAGIQFYMTTDKVDYSEGDEIHFTLTVYNNKDLYTVSQIKVENNCSDEIDGDVPSFSGTITTGSYKTYEGTLTVDSSAMTLSKAQNSETGSFYNAVDSTTDTSVTARPYVKITYGGNELIVRYTVTVNFFQTKISINNADRTNFSTVSVHDPSIVVGEDPDGQKCYYIFGSHLAWAKSYDLMNWETFTNNINRDYKTLFAEPATWGEHGKTGYTVNGYMWAPDVIWNESMQKWCMYMSIDSDNWYSSIVLLTADNLEGDWTYVGEVIYSGFSNEEFYDETDVAQVTGETELADRYKKGSKWGDYYPNMIDPCVFYDEEGNLWMTFGSWSGGIFIIEMDEETGFRDYSVTYENNDHSDPYFGTKIAGGKYVSGEASYVQYYGGYYWLFITYGGLESDGGYNMRVYRSTTPNGGYVDELGNTPYYDTWEQNYNDNQGIRLFGAYMWRTMTNGHVSQGHNSAFVDEDGRMYLIYHTRTTDGSEGHHVEVKQLVLNEDGWLLSLPYQYSGETVDENGMAAADCVGTYEVILHTLNIDYANKETKKPTQIDLNEDGTITSHIGAESLGTWELVDGTAYIHLNYKGEEYHGVLCQMYVEDTSILTTVFTALGTSSQQTLWGSMSIEE